MGIREVSQVETTPEGLTGANFLTLRLHSPVAWSEGPFRRRGPAIVLPLTLCSASPRL